MFAGIIGCAVGFINDDTRDGVVSIDPQRRALRRGAQMSGDSPKTNCWPALSSLPQIRQTVPRGPPRVHRSHRFRFFFLFPLSSPSVPLVDESITDWGRNARATVARSKPYPIRPVDRKSSHRQWEVVPLNPKERDSMGRRNQSECRLVGRQELRRPRWNKGSGTPISEGPARACATFWAANWNRFSSCWDMPPFRPPKGTSDASRIRPGLSMIGCPLLLGGRDAPGRPVAIAKGISRQEWSSRHPETADSIG